MLEKYSTHLRKATPKIIPTWTQYLTSLNIQKEQLRTRFLNSYGMEARGFQILRQMLDPVAEDIEYLTKQPHDYARYINYFLPTRANADRIFRPVDSGRVYRKVFYKKGLFATNEYICPVDDVDHLATLPLGQSWEAWKSVQPVHLWYHDSQEYTLNVLTGQVLFKYTNPSYSVIFIDSIALKYKFYKYMTSDVEGESAKTMHTFIQKHVFPFFFDDLQTIWVLNQILLCCDIEDTSRDTDDIMSDIQASDRQYGYIGGRHHEAVEDLLHALDDVRHGHIRVNSLMSAHLLPTGSIFDRIDYSLKHLDIIHLQQYNYMRILRDMSLFDLIVKMHMWRPDTEIFKSLARQMRYELNRLKINKPWSKINDTAIRAHVELWVNSTLEKVSL